MATHVGARREGQNQKDRGRSWMVLILCFFCQLLFGGIWLTAGMINTLLLEAFHDSRGLTAIPTAIMAAAINLGSFPAAIVDNRFGQSWTLLLGALMASSGLVLSAFASSITWLIPSLGLLCGQGLALCYLPTQTILPQYFKRYLTAAYGISSAGGSTGLLVLSFFITWAEEQYTWRGLLLLLAGMSLQQCIVAFLLRQPKTRYSEGNLADASDQERHLTETSDYERHMAEHTESKLKQCDLIPNGTQMGSLCDRTEAKNGNLPKSHSQCLAVPKQGDKVPHHSALLSHSQDIPTSHLYVQQLRRSQPFSKKELQKSDTILQQAGLSMETETFCLDAQRLPLHSNGFGHPDLLDDIYLHTSKNSINEADSFAIHNFYNENLNRNSIEKHQVVSNGKIINVDTSEKLHFNTSNGDICNSDLHVPKTNPYATSSISLNKFCKHEKQNGRARSLSSSILAIHTLGSQSLSPALDAPDDSGDHKRAAAASFHWEIFLNTTYLLRVANAFLRSASRSILYIFITAFAVERGYSHQQANLLMTLIGVSHLIMRPLSGIVANKFGIHQQLYAGSPTVCGPLICLLYVSSGNLVALYIVVLFYGFAEAMFDALWGAVFAETLEPHQLASGFGAAGFFYGIAAIVSPPLAGWLVDVMGSYDGPLYIAGFLSFLAGAIGFLSIMISKRKQLHVSKGPTCRIEVT